MYYASTRNHLLRHEFTDVLLNGLAPDGGLYIPVEWPSLSGADIEALRGKSYAEIVTDIVHRFVGDTITRPDLLAMAERAYGRFSHDACAPLVQIGTRHFVLELFHGPTFAFKDFALQLLGEMFEHVLRQQNRSLTIIGATSGDTGSAAIRAVAGRRGIRIVMLHPEGRTSDVQRRQMTTVDSSNVLNIAIKGTFDDCQALVKQTLGDLDFASAHQLGAVNSINWVRVMAQSAYYVSSALSLGAPHTAPAYCVPTGNFGDVYAGYVARRMGLPISQLIVATNRNDILHRFFQSGVYASGKVLPTISPSMDIQVSSNFERLLFELCGRDGHKVADLMQQFTSNKTMQVDPDQLAKAQELFASASASEDATQSTIRSLKERTGMVVCPHTAVGIHAADTLMAADQTHPVVTLATAHPAKFPAAVEDALGYSPVTPQPLQDVMTKPEKYETMAFDGETLKQRLHAFSGESV